MSTTSPLAAYRTANDLTLEAAAAKFGIHKTTFMRWEAGQVPHVSAAEVERVTGIPKWKLRPDIWEPPVPTPVLAEPARAQ